MKQTIFFFFALMFFGTSVSQAQDATDTAPNDSLYYDNWVGEWYQVFDDSISSTPTFVVKRALYHASFEEYWMGAGGNFSMAWRAWDNRTKSWEFAWRSSDGFFQNWEGKKVEGIWYMYKTFVIGDDTVLSRQAFIPQDTTTLIRTSEHSRDNGATWHLRFREEYRKLR